MNEQERIIRTWLGARDPGDAPPRLRAAAADVPNTTHRSVLPALGTAMWWVSGRWPSARLVVLLVVLLAIILAAVGAAVLRPWDPFPPRGLIAYTAPNGSTGGSGIRLVDADGTHERAVAPPSSNTYEHSPRWSADGRTLLFARTTELDALSACGGVGSIVVYDVATATERVVATGLRPIGVVEWSPAGDQAAYLWPPPGCGAPGELGNVDVASGKVTTQALAEGTWRLQWSGGSVSAVNAGPAERPSSNGELVAAFASLSPESAGDLQVLQHGAGMQVDLGDADAPAWSPNDGWLAFVQVVDRPPDYASLFRDHLVIARAGSWELWTIADVMVPFGEIPGGRIHITQPYWTQDGKAIYWMDGKGGHVVEVDGGRTADLPAVVNGCTDIQWQPMPQG